MGRLTGEGFHMERAIPSPTSANDPFDLDRFVNAQGQSFARARIGVRHLRLAGRPQAALVATLFARASSPGSLFERLLAKYFDGEEDSATLRLLESAT